MEASSEGWASNPKDGCRIHYQVIGDGPRTIFMLAGADNHPREWGTVPASLVELGYRCVLVDQRGSGKSERPKRPWTMNTAARDVLAVMDALDVSRCEVMGYCYGGMVAQQLAMLAEERVSTLVLVATIGGIPFRLPGPKAIGPARAVPRSAKRQEHPADLTRQMLAVATFMRPLRLRKLRVPTLIIHGAADALFPVSNARSLRRRIRTSHLEVLPGVTHLLPVTDGDKLAELVNGFRMAPQVAREQPAPVVALQLA